MEFLYFDQLYKRPLQVPVLIGSSAAAALILNIYGLTNGITNVLPHLLYIPIILAAYYYPRRGVPFAFLVSVLYCGAVFTLYPAGTDVQVAALARVAVYCVIAAVISYLSGRMHHDTQMCRRLVSIVQSSNDAVIGKTLDGIITDWNPGAENLYGYTEKEVVGNNISVIIPPDRRNEVPHLLEKIRLGEPIERYETERVTRNGTRIQVSLSLSPIKNIQGEIIGASTSAHDISEKKRLQDEILQAKNEWELTFDAVPDMIAIINKDHRILRANKAMTDRLGMQPEEIVGRPCYEVVHHSDAPPGFCPHEVLLDDGKEHSREINEQNLDGDFIVTVSPLRDPAGTLMGSVHILHDITERKKAQDALEERERFLHRLIETIPNPIFYKNKNGIFIGCNTAFEQYLGLSRDQIIGRTVYDIAPGELADVYSARDRELFDNPGTQTYEAKVKYADRMLHDVIFNKSTLNDADGNVDGLVGVILDITERKQMEEANRIANKKLNMLSSITRHDILNQLMGLRAFLELSRDSATDPEFLLYIQKEDEAAVAIEKQIEFTRYYENIGLQAPRWQDVKTCIGAAVSPLKREGIAVDIGIPSLEVFADPLIEKVYYNLVENSLRHGGHISSIVFSAQDTGTGLILSYRDDGVGISAEDKEKLFSKGFGKHTGLGLFLSREILSITGITITECGEPGKGVDFEIRVPKGSYRFVPSRPA